jgi:large conductance mechanosensitive channel protein
MKLLKEFKEFAVKGNVIDLAVAVVIGAAFGKIVSSLVADVIMPFVGLLVGGIDFTKWAIVLKEAADGAPAVSLNIGNFIQVTFDFTIVAFCIFIVVKILNSFNRKKEAPAPAEPSKEEVLLAEIRDILKEKK